MVGSVKTVVRNGGQIVSGDVAAPLLDGDTIVCVDGRIPQVGREGMADTGDHAEAVHGAEPEGVVAIMAVLGLSPEGG